MVKTNYKILIKNLWKNYEENKANYWRQNEELQKKSLQKEEELGFTEDSRKRFLIVSFVEDSNKR